MNGSLLGTSRHIETVENRKDFPHQAGFLCQGVNKEIRIDFTTIFERKKNNENLFDALLFKYFYF